MARFSTRIGKHWLVSTHLHETTWHLQVLGDTFLEAEITARDEAEAKSSAVAATLERLSIATSGSIPTWNAVTTRQWDSRETG
jgi:hypothetical protein